MRYPFLAPFVLALLGAALAVLAYAGPFGHTGVDGSLGALLALVGAVSTTAGSAILVAAKLARNIVYVLLGLSLLAATLTAVAAYFLMQFVFAATMVCALVCLLVAPFYGLRRSKP